MEATEKTGALAIDQPVPAADALLLKALEFKIKVWKVDSASPLVVPPVPVR